MRCAMVHLFGRVWALLTTAVFCLTKRVAVCANSPCTRSAKTREHHIFFSFTHHKY